MWYHPGAFSLSIRDVIGAWLVCLAVVAGFFGYPLVAAAWDASIIQHHAAAGRPSGTAPAKICAWRIPSVELPHG